MYDNGKTPARGVLRYGIDQDVFLEHVQRRRMSRGYLHFARRFYGAAGLRLDRLADLTCDGRP